MTKEDKNHTEKRNAKEMKSKHREDIPAGTGCQVSAEQLTAVIAVLHRGFDVVDISFQHVEQLCNGFSERFDDDWVAVEVIRRDAFEYNFMRDGKIRFGGRLTSIGGITIGVN